jgi:hypothetical protein
MNIGSAGHDSVGLDARDAGGDGLGFFDELNDDNLTTARNLNEKY